MLLGRLSFIYERFEKIRGYLVRPIRVSGRTLFRFQNDNMAIEVWCLHRPAGYLLEILKIEGHLDCNAGNMCCRHTQEELQCGFRA